VIASRDEEKNKEAVQNLTSTVSGADVSYMIFDLESFDSVRSFASDFSSKHDRLDYYFGNAGQGSFGTQPLTVDGYERIFQVNYVSQVLLVELLLPLLRQSKPGRIMLTASSTHATACGSFGLTPEDECWGDGSALALLPFDEAGLEAINNTFYCEPLFSSYPITKYLMTQLAREVSKREAEAGNQVYAYSWAPGNINTNLNPWATCCVGPIDRMECRYQLPYVGPTDEDGNPAPPEVPVPNRWTSPAHGAMAAVFSALVANTTQAGSYFATYWECAEESGYFSQGVTPKVQAEIYDQSKLWARVNGTTMGTDTSGVTSNGLASMTTFVLGALLAVCCVGWL
jgi:NAD(P)-dependent dehydrogenase (short-subunit alcohol dehydrogenase family)